MGLHRWAALTALFALSLAPAVTGAQTDVPPTQILSISTIPRLEPPPGADELINRDLEALNLASGAGAHGYLYSSHWNEIEPTAGHYKLDDLKNTSDYIGDTRGFSIMFGIQVLNTVAREVPPDLADVPFDSPQMKSRFHALIDAVAPYITHRYRYLSIGNEVDVYLANTNQWAAYKAFYEDALAYVHQKIPWLKVGVTVTFGGATSDSVAAIKTLTEHSDVDFLTYYPLNSDFTVRDPAAPLTDFPLMIAASANHPVILQEVGYPASTVLNSSEQKQAAFVRNVYKAWAVAGSRIPFLNFFLMHDFTKALCDQFLIYYGASSQNFYEYLCTLGFRQADGTPRLAWQAFVEGAKNFQQPTQ